MDSLEVKEDRAPLDLFSLSLKDKMDVWLALTGLIKGIVGELVSSPARTGDSLKARSCSHSLSPLQAETEAWRPDSPRRPGARGPGAG